MTSAEYYLRCIADLCAGMSEAQLERAYRWDVSYTHLSKPARSLPHTRRV